MAVQGAAARMMTPAMYSLASSGPIHGRKRCLKNSQPKKAIENGLTSQLTKIVTTRPPGPLADALDRREVDLEHHRVDHQPDEDGDRDVDVAPAAELHVADRPDEARPELADHDAEDHAGRHPQAQVALEDVHLSCSLIGGLPSRPRAAAATIGSLIPTRARSRSARHSCSTRDAPEVPHDARVRLDARIPAQARQCAWRSGPVRCSSSAWR